jgi:hypothetical protein
LEQAPKRLVANNQSFGFSWKPMQNRIEPRKAGTFYLVFKEHHKGNETSASPNFGLLRAP